MHSDWNPPLHFCVSLITLRISHLEVITACGDTAPRPGCWTEYPRYLINHPRQCQACTETVAFQDALLACELGDIEKVG